MSYIQFELDAINLCPLVSRASGVSEEAIGYGLVRLWAHCYRSKIDRINEDLLEGFFPMTERLTKALITFGFLEQDGDELRVRGAGRYVRVSEARREAGRKGGQAKARNRASNELANASQAPSTSKATSKPKRPVEPKATPNDASEAAYQEVGNRHRVASDDLAIAKHQPGDGLASAQLNVALDPRSERDLSKPLAQTRRESSSERAPARPAPARAYEPPDPSDSLPRARVEVPHDRPQATAPALEWPSPECETAGLAWFEHVSKAWPSGGHTLEDAKRAAQAYPDNFAAAARKALAEGLDSAADPVRQLHATCQGLALAGHGPTQPKHGPPPPSWPGPRSEPASRRFMASATANARLSGPSAMLTPHGFADLAREFGDECFDAAVEACIAEGPEWPGWGVKNPLNWLRTQCQDQRFQAKRRSTKQAPGDRYTPRFRPERGADEPVSAQVSTPSRRQVPPPLGRVTQHGPAAELWEQALVTLREFLEPVEFRQYVEPLDLGGLSEGGELVLWCRDEAMRQELDDGIRGFVEGALIAAAREAEGWPEGPPIVRFAAMSEVAA